jgi:uncharacterized protein (TIGR02452 family)
MRIRAVLRIAENHGHQVIVLGAWGSGVFKNPPEIVARLFKEELQNLTANGRKTSITQAWFGITGYDNYTAYRNVFKV